MQDLRILTETAGQDENNIEKQILCEKLALIDEVNCFGVVFLDAKTAVSGSIQKPREILVKEAVKRNEESVQRKEADFYKSIQKPEIYGEIRHINFKDYERVCQNKNKYPNLMNLFVDWAAVSPDSDFTTIGKIAESNAEFIELQKELKQLQLEKLKKENVIRQGYKALLNTSEKGDK